MRTPPRLGMGIGWRPELALAVSRRPGLGFLEITAENFSGMKRMPEALEVMRSRGLQVVPHGLTLSLGGAERVDRARVRFLGEMAAKVGAPLVSEHIAFVRAGGEEAGHLLPVERSRAGLEVLVENVREAMGELAVPLALENVSALFEWPGAEMSEGEFLYEVVERTGCWLLLDVANVWANARNFKRDPVKKVERLPLEKVAYVHVGGGVEREGVYHDTHGHAAPAGVIELLEELCARVEVPGVMLERDDHFPSEAELNRELDAIEGALKRGRDRRG